MQPYRPRARHYRGLLERTGYRLKRYAISVDGIWPGEDWEGAIAAVLTALPQPAVTARRPGVGWLIEHRGRGADYLVLGWWDQENELPLRLRLRDHGGTGWRSGRAEESVCVWDLEVIGFERDAYVDTVLSGGSVEDYLGRHAEDLVST